MDNSHAQMPYMFNLYVAAKVHHFIPAGNSDLRNSIESFTSQNFGRAERNVTQHSSFEWNLRAMKNQRVKMRKMRTR